MDNKRLTPYLRRRCLELTVQDRAALVNILQGSFTMREREKDVERRLDFMAAETEKIAGLAFREKGQNAAMVRARTVFAFVARQEGISQEKVGKYIGRDHSTVCCMERKMEDVFKWPALYADYIELYNKLTNAII